MHLVAEWLKYNISQNTVYRRKFNCVCYKCKKSDHKKSVMAKVFGRVLKNGLAKVHDFNM